MMREPKGGHQHGGQQRQSAVGPALRTIKFRTRSTLPGCDIPHGGCVPSFHIRAVQETIELRRKPG